MSDHSWHWTDETKLPSYQGAHLECMNNILQQLTKLGWEGRDLFGIELTLEESLSNAIRHGNLCEEDKRVHVECKISPEKFWIRVQDEGNGFLLEDVPDCTADENLESPGGRGLTLMRAYMTHVEYNGRGNCVTMEKSRSKGE